MTRKEKMDFIAERHFAAELRVMAKRRAVRKESERKAEQRAKIRSAIAPFGGVKTG